MYNVRNSDITGDTTFINNGFPYVFAQTPQGYSPKIMPGATLTIEPGVVVVFGSGYIPNTPYYACEGLEVHGNIKATGATFTWFKQGSYWGTIDFLSNASGSFTDCIIEHSSGWYGVLRAWNNNVAVNNAKIELSGGSITDIATKVIYFNSTSSGSIKIDGTNITNVDSVIEITRESIGIETIINNCVIENTRYQAIVTGGGNLTVTNSTFRKIPYAAINTWALWHHPDNVILTNNIFDGGGLYEYPLRLYLGSNINKDVIEHGNTFINYPTGYNTAIMSGYIPENQHVYWGDIGARYYMQGSPNGSQNFNCSLTIGPGVSLSTTINFTFYGDFSALGTSEKPITFTSEYDPKNYIFGKGHVFFNHCIFQKVYYAIQIEDCALEDISTKVSLTVRNSIFRNNGLRAIWLRVNKNYNLNNVLIDNCSFIETDGNAIYFEPCNSDSKPSARIVASTFLYTHRSAVFLTHHAELTFENCNFLANHDYGGRAIDCSDYYSCRVYLKNCIVWYNSILAALYPNTFIVNHSCIQISDSDLSRINGSNNINFNPMFEGSIFPIDVYVNSSINNSGDGSIFAPYKTISEAITTYQDSFSYALVTGSPCIGTGENGANMGAPNGIVQSQKTTAITIHLSQGEYDITGLFLYHNISIIGENRESTKLKGAVLGLQTGARLEKVKLSDNTTVLAVLTPAYQSPIIEDCTITNNTPPSGFYGAGINIYYGSSPSIKNCIISSNHGGAGGIIYAGEKTSPTITDCIINDNGTDGVYSILSYRTSNLTVKNCIVSYSNSFGIYVKEGSAVIENCTISKCKACGIYNDNATMVVHNCIVYDNCTRWYNPATDNIRSNPSRIAISYCDVKGWTGNDNIDTDPLFVDTVNQDFHLKSEGGRWNPQTNSWIIDSVTSPCIDTGDPTSDCSKEPQPNGGRINIGAYGNTIYASKSKTAVDLQISKIGQTSPVYLGGNIAYTFALSNAGSSTATGVKFEDLLESNVALVSADSTKGSCYFSAGKVISEIGELIYDELVSITIIVTPNIEGNITNTATISGNEYDIDTSNNSVTETTQVLPATDLSIVVNDSPDPVRVGETLTYTITVLNSGPSLATGVKVIAQLPDTVNYLSAMSTKGDCYQSDGIVSCEVGVLSKDEAADITIKVIPLIDGTITSIVSASCNEYDSDTSNNSATEITEILPVTDLIIVKNDSPDPVKVNEILTYIITVLNSGPSLATGVKVEDTLPDTVNYLSAISSKGNCIQSEGIVSCEVGDLSKGETAVITIKVIPSAIGTITNTATVLSNEYDSDTSNNSATETTEVIPVADLSIITNDSPHPVRVNETLTYTITVLNSGPSLATGVRVIDSLPDTVNYLSSVSTKGTCSQSESIVSCEVGSLSKDESAVITIEVSPSAEGTITNTATVSGNEYDPYTNNNSYSQDTVINPPPTPQELITELTTIVIVLVSQGELNNGQGNSIIVKLNGALDKINRGNINAAKNQLNAFINEVTGFIINGNLSLEIGRILIVAATKIIDSL